MTNDSRLILQGLAFGFALLAIPSLPATVSAPEWGESRNRAQPAALR